MTTTLLQRTINPGTQWQHLNQSIYIVLGTGIYVDNCSVIDVLTSKYTRHGKFNFLGFTDREDRPMSLYQYGEELVYGGKRNLGEIVFYYGTSGRWARPKEIFLGEKCGRQRFTEVLL